jgi:hypothetical protein
MGQFVRPASAEVTKGQSRRNRARREGNTERNPLLKTSMHLAAMTRLMVE